MKVGEIFFKFLLKAVKTFQVVRRENWQSVGANFIRVGERVFIDVKQELDGLFDGSEDLFLAVRVDAVLKERLAVQNKLECC